MANRRPVKREQLFGLLGTTPMKGNGRVIDTREFSLYDGGVDFDEAVKALNGHDLMSMRPAAVYFYRHFRAAMTEDDISRVVCLARDAEIIFWQLMLESEHNICVANLFPNYPEAWRV